MNASAALNSLVPNTTYYFRLNAQNQFSTVNGSIETFKTGMQVVEALPTVSTKSASNITTTTATLQALVNPNALDTTYWFEYSTDSVLSTILVKTTGRQVLSADHNLTGVSADVSSLQNKTNYYYRVAAQNSLGIVYSDKVSFKTK
jgi:phosphodiesterase/alkaline phosphatase D-like protein